MYRPNRIGQHNIGNLDKPFLTDTSTTFAGRDSAYGTYSTYSLNIVSGIEFTKEHFIFTDLGGPSLVNVKQVGLGVQLGGEDYLAKHMYEIEGTVQWYDSDHIQCEMVVGRLSAAPNAAAPITVLNPIVLPLYYFKYNNLNYASCKETLVTQLMDGGSPPATNFDIACFWRFSNISGSDTSLRGLTGNIGIHKYLTDFKTFDPTR